jgi:hypothetical protein
MALMRRDAQHHTYGEYLTWSDDCREGKPYRVYVFPFDVRLPKSDEVDDLIDLTTRARMSSHIQLFP